MHPCRTPPFMSIWARAATTSSSAPPRSTASAPSPARAAGGRWPTSLLAMVASAVGGKVAVNHPRAKNLIGVFHQPVGVWIDTATLATLPQRDYHSGLAEVVKYGVIFDAELFAYLERNADAVLRR